MQDDQEETSGKQETQKVAPKEEKKSASLNRGFNLLETPFKTLGKTGRSVVPDEETFKEFVEYNRFLASQPACKYETTSWKNPTFGKCQCLKMLLGSTSDDDDDDAGDDSDNDADHGKNDDSNNDGNNENNMNDENKQDKDFYLRAVATFQMYFGKLPRRDQQLKVMDWIRYASYGPKDGDKRRVYMLPYLIPDTEDEDKEKGNEVKEKEDNDDSSVPAASVNRRRADKKLQILIRHRICRHGLMNILGIGMKWWKRAQGSVENHRLPAIHAGTGQMGGRKRKFVEEEQQVLIQFFEDLKQYAEPTRTRKRPGQKENIIYYLDPSWSKRYCYKRYCALRGKIVHTTPDGCIILEDMPGVEAKSCVTWRTFLKYWAEFCPELRLRPPTARAKTAY